MASMVRRLAVGVAAFGVVGCAHLAEPPDHVITIWHPFDLRFQSAMEAMVRGFEKEHPGVKVRLSYSSNNLTSNQKLFLAIAGGVGPDVTFIDGQQLSEWAARGALADLTDALKGSELKPEDFWGPRWRESTFRGRVYALPWGADPNFGLAWNKDLFRKAGLDPERPPRTIRELDADNARLTTFDSHGGIVTVGLVPWQWAGANGLFTWGYAFGGSFYQEPTPANPIGQVTADNPGVVKALEWMGSFAKRYDVRKVNAYNSQFVGVSNNPFYLGKSAMSIIHINDVHQLREYAPTINCGIGFLPAPEGGEYPTGWIGGWSLGIPRGKKVSKDAFEFVRWMCTSKTATSIMATQMYQFPAYRRSEIFKKIRQDPQQRVFYEILSSSKHVRTLMPVQGYYMDLLGRAVDEVLYGDRPAKDALAEASAKAQKRLELVLGALARRGGAQG